MAEANRLVGSMSYLVLIAIGPVKFTGGGGNGELEGTAALELRRKQFCGGVGMDYWGSLPTSFVHFLGLIGHLFSHAKLQSPFLFSYYYFSFIFYFFHPSCFN